MYYSRKIDVEFNHHYIIYNNKHFYPVYKYRDLKIHFIGKKDNENYKSFCFQEEYDGEEIFSCFMIIENGEHIFNIKYDTYEDNDEDFQRIFPFECKMRSFKHSIKLLQNIDKISSEEDFENLKE